MSRTDKTRPWWVRLADRPGVTYVAVHDHRFGECTLADEITPETASLNRAERGCHWAATDHFLFDLGGVSGGREWHHICREARRDLRAYRGED